ncbi:hypothetical protein JHN45_37480 [Streptomyces sp. MBT53]|nr:hypothetical protein [Streptomyces sp. MBT53]
MIKLERSSEDARQQLAGLVGEEYEAQWKAWRAAAEDFQAAVTVYTTREEVTLSRHEVEQAAKRAVRHAEPSGA